MRASPAFGGAGAAPAAPGRAPSTERPGATEPRWDRRPVLAAGLRSLALAIPLLASLVAAWLMARTLGAPVGAGEHILWWVGVLAASLGALVVFDRAARRLLPLAALLRLSLVFPDRAPSRMGVALRSGSTKRLQARELEALQRGDLEPAEAAHTILALASSLNTHDRNTRGHSERVRAYADLIGAELGLDTPDRDRLRWAALLHDLGKLSVSPSTLNAHHQLGPDDWEALRRHPLEGARLAEPLRAWLGPWALAIEQHHERYDGTGYPHGLAGTQISLGARIVAVADSYDAMTSVRSYSAGISAAAARRELAGKAGTDFDPTVVRAFMSVALGRLRWVMGPFAFLSVLPFAPALGGVRRSVEAAGRTAAMGTVTLVAAATALQPPAMVEDVPVRDEPRPARSVPVPAAAPAPVAPPEEPPAVPEVAVPEVTAAEAAPAAPLPTPPSPAPAPAPAPAPPPPVPVETAAPAPETPPPPPPAPEPAPAPAPECRVDGRSDDSGRPCEPPRWGQTETGNPSAKGRA
ncbi:MAG: HD-GYP domain-containing protein [Actinomycetota bacterium]